MKLYYFPVAPNPTKVRVFVAEKGIDLEMVEVSLPKGEQNAPEHLARNPRGALPVLELDDGSYITESLPIMEYLEEIYPEPAMIGTDPLSRARARELERQAEQRVMNPMARLVHSTNSPLGLPPNPPIAEVERERLLTGLGIMDDHLQNHPFVGGERPAIGDCTLFGGLFFGEFFGQNVGDEFPEVQAWYAQFKQRPSTQG